MSTAEAPPECADGPDAANDPPYGLLPVAPVPPYGVPPNGMPPIGCCGNIGWTTERTSWSKLEPSWSELPTGARRERRAPGAFPSRSRSAPGRSRPGAASTRSAAPYRRDRHLELRLPRPEALPDDGSRPEPRPGAGIIWPSGRDRSLARLARRAVRGGLPDGGRISPTDGRLRRRLRPLRQGAGVPPQADRRQSRTQGARAHARLQAAEGTPERARPRRPSRSRCASATSSATTA